MNDLKNTQNDSENKPVAPKQSNTQAVMVMLVFIVMIIFIIAYEIYTKK